MLQATLKKALRLGWYYLKIKFSKVIMFTTSLDL